jgi:hypothetical protein
VRPGGLLCGDGFVQRPADMMRAVANCFDLMDVGVSPDAVWFVVIP